MRAPPTLSQFNTTNCILNSEVCAHAHTPWFTKNTFIHSTQLGAHSFAYITCWMIKNKFLLLDFFSSMCISAWSHTRTCPLRRRSSLTLILEIVCFQFEIVNYALFANICKLRNDVIALCSPDQIEMVSCSQYDLFGKRGLFIYLFIVSIFIVWLINRFHNFNFITRATKRIWFILFITQLPHLILINKFINKHLRESQINYTFLINIFIICCVSVEAISFIYLNIINYFEIKSELIGSPNKQQKKEKNKFEERLTQMGKRSRFVSVIF